MKEKIDLIEALLFARSEGMYAEDISKYTEIPKKEVVEIIEELQKYYTGRGIEITNTDNLWRMTVREDLIEKMKENIPVEMKPGLMRTLAVIAYKSPVPQMNVIQWRGTNAYLHIKELVEQELVEKIPEGNTFILRVTTKFRKYFAVRKKNLMEEGKKATDFVKEKIEKKKEELEKQEEKVVYEGK